MIAMMHLRLNLVLFVAFYATDLVFGFTSPDFFRTTFPLRLSFLAEQQNHRQPKQRKQSSSPTCIFHHGKYESVFDEISRRDAILRSNALFWSGVASSGIVASQFDPEPASANVNTLVDGTLLDAVAGKISALERDNLDKKCSRGPPEEHTPIVTVEDGIIQVQVPHVMGEGEFIGYIWLRDVTKAKDKQNAFRGTRLVAAQEFKPSDPSPPTLRVRMASGQLPTLTRPSK